MDCPELLEVLNENQCEENFAGVSSTVYIGLKSDLSTPMKLTDCTYSTPTFKEGKGLYKLDCDEEKNKITGGSLGFRGGFKLTFDMTTALVNKATAMLGRAVNNLDIFFIVEDGEDSQIMYHPQRRVKFDADGIQSDTGAATSDQRTTHFVATLGPVKHLNQFVTAPTEGWESLRVKGLGA